MPTGKAFYLPLTGSDPGQTISYSVASSNPDVHATVFTGNPTLKLTVHGTDNNNQAFSGTMTLQLFQNLAPNTVGIIEGLVNSGFYTNQSFYRIIPGFVIQGGANGSKTANPFANEFNQQLAFNSPGMLAMAANSQQLPNSSEIFVSDIGLPLASVPQFLNYGYTVFGQLTSGFDIYNEIKNAKGISSSNSTPSPLVIIDSATIINDTQNGVVQITGPDGSFTGTSTITVTAHATDNTQTQQTFSVSFAPPAATGNNPILLSPVADQTTVENKPITFQLSAEATQGRNLDDLAFSVTAADNFTGAPANVTVQVTPGSGQTATVTLTPATGFTGTINLVAHVHDNTTQQQSFPLNDALPFTLTVTPLHAPAVTGTVTARGAQNSTGLVITPNALDVASGAVTNFQITGITGGTLFQHDGITPIVNGQFISLADGAAGLKFTPTPGSNANGSFAVQTSVSADTSGLGGPVSTATITVFDPPGVTNSSTSLGTQTTSGLVVTPNQDEASVVTHFQITDIVGGLLFKHDGTTPITNGQFITVAEAAAGLRFTPNLTAPGTASFAVHEATGTTQSDVVGPSATATITVTLHSPNVTGATTPIDSQNASGLVITPNAANGDAVTNYQITGIVGGSLFLHDGVTPIANGQFITAAQGAAGLKFTPDANTPGNGSFSVQASISANADGLSGPTATATIVLVRAPNVTNTTTTINTQSNTGLVITPNAHDAGVAAGFQISGITGGSLFLADGTTLVANGAFITLAQGAAGLKFTPITDSTANGSFIVKESTTGDETGVLGPAATATITVSPLHAPNVTGATTIENIQTSSGLVITANPADGDAVTHFQITGITGGTLFQHDGTPISEGAFITLAQGQAGLRFTPTSGSTTAGSFIVQESTSDNSAEGLRGPAATATITINPLHAPNVTNATTVQNVQTSNGLVITPNAADVSAVTFFQITSITGGSLFQHDGTTAIHNGDFISVAQGAAGLRFTPTSGSTASGSFVVQVSTSDNQNGLGGPTATATITVATLHAPNVTNASTVENTLSTSGLVITPNQADSAVVIGYQITAITGGNLFKHDGATAIHSGDFITSAEGAAGLRFLPTAGSTANGSFGVQETTNLQTSGLGGPVTTATITVSPALTGTLSGFVYNDHNGSGHKDSDELGIKGIVVALNGADAQGNPIATRTTTTAADGSYQFTGLPAGTYRLTEARPAGLADGTASVGSLGGQTSTDAISGITLAPGGHGTDYDFSVHDIKPSQITLGLFLASTPSPQQILDDMASAGPAAPFVVSIVKNQADPTNAGTVSYAVNFNENVTGVDATDFSVIPRIGVGGASVASVTGSGSAYTVTLNTGTGSGMLGLSLNDNDSIVAQSAPLGGSGAGNGDFVAPSYDINKLTVAIASATSPVSATNAANVTVSGTGEIAAAISLVVTDGVHTVGPSTTSVGSNGQWSISAINVSTLNDGTITYTATATNAAGDTAVASTTATKNTASSSSASPNAASQLADPRNSQLVDQVFGNQDPLA